MATDLLPIPRRHFAPGLRISCSASSALALDLSLAQGTAVFATMFSLAARRVVPLSRNALTRSLHISTHSRVLVARPLVLCRLEHTAGPEPTLKERADHQGDWITPVVPYERVKQLTEQPSEVRIISCMQLWPARLRCVRMCISSMSVSQMK